MTTTKDPTTAETLHEAARLAAAYRLGWSYGVQGRDYDEPVTDLLAWGMFQCGYDDGQKLRAS